MAINTWFRKKLDEIWYQTGISQPRNACQKSLLAFLLAFSWVYRAGAFLRKLSYRFGLQKVVRLSVPVIVVGNVTVGGTGKTPLIIALANFLAGKGYRPGIVSRGYGSQAKKFPIEVYASSDPAEAGDEPLLIARRTMCPLVIDPRRVRAAQRLLAHYPCDVILSDDGLQHTALGRDIEIIVIDGVRRFGNGFCLPAGPLREPITRLKTATFIVAKGQALAGEWFMQIIPGSPVNLVQPERLFSKDLAFKTIHAIAGIGNPQNFFEQLRSMGFSVIEHAFPDHYAYKPADLDFKDDRMIIMTEKDAVKCQSFADERYWYLPVSADCGSIMGEVSQMLDAFTSSYRRKPVSSLQEKYTART